MKHFMRFAAVAVLSLALGGCWNIFDIVNPDGRSILRGGTSIIAKTENPVSRTNLAAIAVSYNTIVLGVNAYYRRPLCQSGTTTSWSNLCSEPEIRRELARYRRAAWSAIQKARDFQKRGDVNAFDLIRAAGNVVADFKAVATVNGVKTQ